MLVAVGLLEGDENDRAKLKIHAGLQRQFVNKCLKLN